MLSGDVITLRMERLSYNGGRGIGRFEGLVVFVAETAPDELIEAKVTAVKKNFAEAELIRVLEPSTARRLPPCPVFSRCGGCCWQHITYPEQLNQKEAFLRHSLTRALRTRVGDVTNITVQMVAAPDEFRYRNRVQVHIEGEQFGFYAKRSRELVPITDCLITEAALLENFHPAPAASHVELSFDEAGKPVARELDDEGPSFAQVNTKQNAVLQKAVTEYVRQIHREPSRVFDFYCGDGNLSRPLLKQFHSLRLTGVELSKSAVHRAVELANRNGFAAKSEFKAADVGKYLAKLGPSDVEGAILIFDPPRAGLGRALVAEAMRLSSHLLGLILVSCDLASFERDVGLLSDAFELKSVTGIDMFPQSDYVEAVALFLSRAAHKA